MVNQLFCLINGQPAMALLMDTYGYQPPDVDGWFMVT